MFNEPMLLATSPEPFSDPHYIFEPKIDGHRLLFSQQNGQIRLYTRHETDCTRQYPELLTPFDDDILLDGEVSCSGQDGVDFEKVMTRFQAKKDPRIKQLVVSSPVTYVVFDILLYKGRDLRKLPLMQRKEILQSIKMPNHHFGIIPFVEGAGEALFDQMKARKLEGMVGKRKNSLYVSTHSLRHTHCSLLAEAGVSLEQIMQRLGHSNDDITRKIYLHITKPKRKEASQKFGELMRNL